MKRRFSLLMALWSLTVAAHAADLRVFVTIAPQKYFVERVAGTHAEVSVLVPSGQGHETYEPGLKQMSRLSEADLYWRIGMPFEDIWLTRVLANAPRIAMLDARKSVALRRMDHDESEGHAHPAGAFDPHIWLDPSRVKFMTEQLAASLARTDPPHKAEYMENYRRFARELEQLDTDLKSMFAPLKGKRFMVFHPNWGYFAEAYGIEQVAVESEGREPGPRALTHLVEFARAQGVKVILVEPQFNRRQAEGIAHAIGAKLVAADPMSGDYPGNLRRVALALAQAMQP